MAGEAGPARSPVPADPYFAAGSPQIETDGFVRVARHRLALDRKPGAPGKSFVEPLPRLSGVARDIAARLSIRAGARPYLGAVHGKDPDRVGIARMEHERK